MPHMVSVRRDKPLWLVTKSLVFCALLFAMLSAVNFVMMPAGVTNGWADVVGLPGELDVLALGTSHIQCTILPMEMWRTHGITSVDLAGPIQTMPVTRAYFEQALKTQSPQVVLLDTTTIGKQEVLTISYAHYSLDHMPIGLARSRAITTVTDASQWEELVLPWVAYHSRWAELTDADWSIDKFSGDRSLRGSAYWAQSKPMTLPFTEDAVSEESYLEDLPYIEQMAQLAEDHDIKLVIFSTVISAHQVVDGQPLMERLREDLSGDYPSVDYLDLNQVRGELNLDDARDWLDDHHLNHRGAVKASAWIANYLSERHGVSDRRSAPFAAAWNDTLANYDRDYPADW